MRNFKTFLVIALSIFIASCVTTKLPENYVVKPEVLETHGGKVSISVTGEILPKSFHKKAVVEFQPYIKYNGGTQDLKPLVLKGEKALGDGIVIPTKTGGKITYSDVFDYKPEMTESEVWVKIKVKKGTKELQTLDLKLADGIIITPLRVGRGENVVVAEHGYEKVTMASKKANLYFAYNMSNLDMKLKLNKDNKAQLDELMAFIGKGWTIKSINIDAYASPEGELTLNQKLSEERNTTAKKYLVGEIKKMSTGKKAVLKFKDVEKEIAFAGAAKGADYDGFMKALNASNIPDKAKIENVIKSQGTKTGREEKIRDMTVIYQEVETMLSVLRRAEFTVLCYEPKLTDEQIANFATSKPDSLKLEELLYAATLTQDLNTQLNIYKNTIKIYPENWKAYNAAGALYLKLGNLEDAKKMLEKADALNPNNGMIANNRGVVAAWEKNYEVAEKLYATAQSQGVDVTYNMGVMKMLKGDYQGAVNAFNSKKCDYNLALAQLANGNATEASKILDCAPKSGEVYYLLAIIGARTNNTSMLYDNLKNAVDAVPAYKATEKADREFIKFFGKTEFQNIVK